jgi:hypothetical protein
VVAQHGYGVSDKPRIRYAALRKGLEVVASEATKARASIHMPRIGAGQAGGHWSVIQDLILDTFADAGVHVTVYDLPGALRKEELQLTLPLARST